MCPACSTVIRHHAGEETPRPDTIYRCHVCRLELVGSANTKGFTVAPLRSDADDTPPRTPIAKRR